MPGRKHVKTADLTKKKFRADFGRQKIGAQVYHGYARGSFDVVFPLLDICDASVAAIPVRGYGTFCYDGLLRVDDSSGFKLHVHLGL